MHDGQLDNWKHYLDDNPRRLMMKRQNPELFTVLTGMEVAGEQCQVVGNRFPKLYKLAGEAFDACAAGLLLQISPWEFHVEKRVISRAQCLHLNALAERIAGDE